jgi:hypothetical protein
MSAPYPTDTPPNGTEHPAQPVASYGTGVRWGEESSDPATSGHPVSTATEDLAGGEEEPAAAALEPPRKGRRIGVMIAVLLIALLTGFGIGTAATDPTASTEYRDLTRARNVVVAERDALTEDRDDLTGEVSSLNTEIGTLEGEVQRLEGVVADIPEREKAVTEREGAVTAREDAASAKEAELGERELAVGIAEDAAAANTFDSGIWTVGEDIAPGVYKVKEALSGYCSWRITVTGSTGWDSIDSDIVFGGIPRVTLSAGQTFESSDCGEWTKVN